MNIRPVRFPPCAAGARPTTASDASGGPNPGTGLPQYSQSWNARRVWCGRPPPARPPASGTPGTRSRRSPARRVPRQPGAGARESRHPRGAAADLRIHAFHEVHASAGPVRPVRCACGGLCPRPAHSRHRVASARGPGSTPFGRVLKSRLGWRVRAAAATPPEVPPAIEAINPNFFGAVGWPDNLLKPGGADGDEAHCDNADYLDPSYNARPRLPADTRAGQAPRC